MSVNGKKVIASRRTILPDGVIPAIIVINNGKIQAITKYINSETLELDLRINFNNECDDFGDMVVMPGLVDSHVHVNEPGRTEWEGFRTATRAAAAGGITTIVDMPLNSIPPTITLENLETKIKAASEEAFVNIAFWGGYVPGNEKELQPLVDAGVVGFKCFLCDSGVEEFPHVNEDDLKKVLFTLRELDTVLAFHAEREVKDATEESNGDPQDYDTYLKTRPPIMETDAIKMIIDLCNAYKTRCHVVHLSTAEALSLIKEAKREGLPLTVETCYHYLCLSAEKIPRSATQFKCCPPIRNEANKEKLWDALKDGTINLVVSDHSPCTAELKKGGNFLTAWGGISSLQFGLSLLWTEARTRGFSFNDIVRLLCTEPAKLCNLDKRKGELRVNMDADIVVWDPDATIQIEEAIIRHKNKVTPYLGGEFYGKVIATMVKGNYVYKDGLVSAEPRGNLLLRSRLNYKMR